MNDYDHNKKIGSLTSAHNELPDSIKIYIKHLERVRRDFVANVSHELRTPLTVIQGYLETLIKHDRYDGKSLKKIFAQMYQHSLRMADIIEDLLLLSHLESDDHPSEQKQVDVAMVLKRICVDAKNLSGEKKHKIILKASSDIWLNGSESELQSLFSNIIFNAVKYTGSKGHIIVEWCLSENREGLFKVKDTGIGIASDHIPRITERFYRVDKARSRDKGGTGLGLAIVKHVLLRHHGELHIESELGKGSQFTCIFPENRITSS